ncbi:DUF4344 domain-containing metallopeptidase [Streptomyces virginiae]|uniref:DUF4344 domain-containing metallopeptidase n=1 Tax=Streptomyces virginiae TaxID=1961 RepID=UPI002DC01EF9|nr:DUF4344 domain-containing metallopeptidase [Streptomyces sp. CMAA1738]MEC4572539.1 DUF4344 domain-containing metallopeptidase [Streptomyces sp. CMAA1738]
MVERGHAEGIRVPPRSGKEPTGVLSSGRGRRSTARAVLAGTLLAASLAGVVTTGAGAAAAADGTPDPKGKVTIVYEDDAIKPVDRPAVDAVRKSRVLEQLADWVNGSVALPHDLVVKVTDKVPPGVSDAVTQPDGRTIFIPPSFLTEIEESLDEVVKTVKRPALFPEDKYNARDLTVLSTQFVFGHEMGHALQRQLKLANLGLEEDAADGFASFYTVNEVGPDPSVAAAILFDEVARKQGQLTMEGFASDHPVTQQRVFNFLCYLEGSDPKKFDGPLVDAGYLPRSRAPLCPQAWAMLDHGWWTQLQPHFTEAFKTEGDKTRAAAYDRLVAETKAFAEKLDDFRTSQ